MPALAIERQVGSVVALKYLLVRVIGRGGMGVVYEAEHTMTRRRVAVKILHAHHKESPDAAHRFLNEAQSAGRIQHPNVVEVLDAGEDTDGSLYLVLELLTGQDLSTLLIRHRHIEIAHTITIIAQVLQALIVAHRQGIVHRDIKPENIYLTQSLAGDTHVKLLDFGISKAIEGHGQQPALSVTQTNTTVGTPHYMSPEQARGERNIDARADLWAVGVVLYECLSGKVPFEGATYNDQIVRVITEPHFPLTHSDVPLALSRIVDRALAKDRTKRYSQAEEMLAEIRAFVDQHREYSSMTSQYLREPARPPSVPPPRVDPGQLTVQTTHDPEYQALLGPSKDTLPTAPVAPSVTAAPRHESFLEEEPTTIRFAPEERAPSRVATGPVPIWNSVPQTLGAVPMAAPPPASHAPGGARLALIAVASVFAIAGLVVFGVSLTSRHHVAPLPLESSAVTLRFVGAPRGAEILVAGMRIADPSGAAVPRVNQSVAIEVSAPGYQTARFALVPDRDQTVPLMLQPIAPIAAPNSDPQADMTFVAPSPDTNHGPAHDPSNGWITIHAEPACTLSIDGHMRGSTPFARAAFPAGAHLVLCRTEGGAVRSRAADVTAGHDTVVEFQP